MAESLFSVGMGPNQIDPSKLAQVSNQLAIVKGTVAGLQQAAQGQAARAMEAATVPLDQIAGPIHEGVGNALGGVQIAQTQLSTHGNMSARALLEPAVRQLVPLGYTPSDLSILTPPRRSNGRRRKNGPSLGPQMAVAQPRIAVPQQSIGSSSGTISQSNSSLTPGTPGQYVPGGQTCQTPGGAVVPCAFPLPGGPAPSPPALPVPPLPLPGGGTAPTAFNPMPPIGGATGCTAQGVPVACAPAGAPVSPPPSPPPSVTTPGGQTLPTCGYVVVQDLTPQGTPTGNAPWLYGVREWLSQYAAGGNTYSLVGPILAYYPTSDAAFGSWPNLRGGLWSPSDACALPPGAPPPGQLQPSPPATCPPPTIACPSPQVTVNVPPCPTGQERPTPPEGECSIAWLNLYYPDFVLASRATGKSDYDILVDAVSLELCQGKPEQPGCSMPYLQRLFPDFVRAAKEQGLSDDELLQQAVNIGLCADVPVTTGLGEINVGYLAPGSAEALKSEFDPPPGSGAPGAGPRSGSGVADPPPLPGQQTVDTRGTDFCWQVWAIPGPESEFNTDNISKFSCLTGIQRVIYAVVSGLESGIVNTCGCTNDSVIQDIGLALNQLWNQNSWWSKSVYYVGQSLMWLFRETGCNLVQFENWFNALSGCQEGGAGAAMLGGLLLGLWKRWVGEIPEPLWDAVKQTIGLLCPTGLPNVAEANDLLASNFISKEDWNCLARANGVLPDYQQPLVQARQRRPNDEELLTRQRYLTYRIEQLEADNEVTNAAAIAAMQEELKFIDKLYLNNGWTNEKWWIEWQNCQQWVPTTSDAIEWMIKDVNDPQITDTFTLDAEFTQKYGGDVKRSFQQNGVSDSDALNIWKAHWRNIAPHQIYEMHKRLRPGWTLLMTDAEVTGFIESICPRKGPLVDSATLEARPFSNGFPVPTYCDELPDPTIQRTYLESLVVTGYHASEALGQDDYPAFWRPRLLALSYNVLTRVDARRAYEIGVFDDTKLTAVLQDRGYKPTDAIALTEFYHKNNVQRFVRSVTAKEWIAFPYDTELLYKNLLADGMRPDLWQEIIPILELKQAVYQMVQKLKSVKKQVLGGKQNRQQAVNNVAAAMAGVG